MRSNINRLYDGRIQNVVAIVKGRMVLERLIMVLRRVYDQSQIVAIVNEICDDRRV